MILADFKPAGQWNDITDLLTWTVVEVLVYIDRPSHFGPFKHEPRCNTLNFIVSGPLATGEDRESSLYVDFPLDAVYVVCETAT